jgi:hypothetical protein
VAELGYCQANPEEIYFSKSSQQQYRAYDPERLCEVKQELEQKD